MFEGIRYRCVEQYMMARKALLATGGAILAEASPHDRIWGIGLSADDPKAVRPDQWQGQNLLGRILMEIRDRERSRA